jgi:hypothetical protein
LGQRPVSGNKVIQNTFDASAGENQYRFPAPRNVCRLKLAIIPFDNVSNRRVLHERKRQRSGAGRRFTVLDLDLQSTDQASYKASCPISVVPRAMSIRVNEKLVAIEARYEVGKLALNRPYLFLDLFERTAGKVAFALVDDVTEVK